jgi:microsomal dipeptidase-like Zn-dependent dipeptidase
LLVATSVLGWAAPAGAAPLPLAGHCLALTAKGTTTTVFLKATGPGTFLLQRPDGSLAGDGRPGPGSEWRITRTPRGLLGVRSVTSGAALSGSGVFRARRATGCRPYPEAQLGARGAPAATGSLSGWADVHLHITADGRGGGLVISGQPFDRFGITEALGHDADVHGPDGSLDITGNLLRSGAPVGTHDTGGWPGFGGWPTAGTLTHQQLYWRWLQRAWRSGMRLAVAQTVEDEPLCRIEPRRSHECDETAAIEAQIRQLRQLQQYIDAQYGGPGRGWFRLVTGPGQAARVIRAGKLAVLIGIESSDPFGCSQTLGVARCDRADIDAAITRFKALGVRTVFLAHWVDNGLGGAALEDGAKGQYIAAMQVTQTGMPFRTGPCPTPEQGEEQVPGAGRTCNQQGLTELGAYTVGKLMDAQILIEADHLSEGARDALLDIAERRRVPIVSSHTGTGGRWTHAELKRLYALGGFATARPAGGAAELPARLLSFAEDQVRGPVGVALGTDTGGFADLPGPGTGKAPLRYPFRSFDGRVQFTRQQTGSRTFDLNTDGVAHYGLMPDLLALVAEQPRGREALGVLFRSTASYLDTWRRTGAR